MLLAVAYADMFREVGPKIGLWFLLRLMLKYSGFYESRRKRFTEVRGEFCTDSLELICCKESVQNSPDFLESP